MPSRKFQELIRSGTIRIETRDNVVGQINGLAVIGAGWAILLPTLALVADTITDSAWLEPRDDAPVAQRRGVSGYVPAARPVPVPVYEKESNRVR